MILENRATQACQASEVSETCSILLIASKALPLGPHSSTLPSIQGTSTTKYRNLGSLMDKATEEVFRAQTLSKAKVQTTTQNNICKC